jgi:hypothetical protein
MAEQVPGAERIAASPNPVPAPTAQSSAAFNLNVSFDFNRDSDVLRVLVRDPHDGGERAVNCGVGSQLVDLPPGDHTLRVEIIQHFGLGLGKV